MNLNKIFGLVKFLISKMINTLRLQKFSFPFLTYRRLRSPRLCLYFRTFAPPPARTPSSRMPSPPSPCRSPSTRSQPPRPLCRLRLRRRKRSTRTGGFCCAARRSRCPAWRPPPRRSATISTRCVCDVCGRRDTNRLA